MDFAKLVQAIIDTHQQAHVHAAKAINSALTLRNWLIGAYVAEFELHGEDRAAYGDGLFSQLSERLTSRGVPNCGKSRLYRYRDFYRTYPQIVATLPPLFHERLVEIGIPADMEKVATLSPLSGRTAIEKFSYSHFELLIEISDPLKRSFYEMECIKGNWSVL
jgi:hypothetical protein